MWGKSILTVSAAGLLAIALPVSAGAQTPGEYADQWTEARRGDRDWMQRATEQLTTGPLDRMMGPSAEGAIKQITNHVNDHIDAMYNRRMDPCLAAAVNQAHNQTLTVGRQEIMKGAAEMLFDAGGGAAGGRNLAEFLGQTLYEQIKDKIKDKAIDQFKGQMRDRMKQGLPVYFRSNDNRAPCRTEFRIVWDKSAERYEFLFAGDCACNTVPCGKVVGGSVPLGRWAITGSGTVVPDIQQAANGDIRITYVVSRPRDVQVTANCCRGEGEQRFRTDPRNGAGNEWVGFVRPLEPPRLPDRPQTGGQQPGTTGTATLPGGTGRTQRPPSGPPPIQVPVIPDGPLTDKQLEELEQKVFDAAERAQAERQAADTRVIELERSSASAEELAAARAAAEAAAQTHREARAAQQKLTDKLNEQQQQQQEEQSSIPPDPASAQVLAIHNLQRSEVGVSPLRWDRQLADNATAYAQRLASGQSQSHASRAGRETEHENLSLGFRNATPGQMMQNWLREKRNFKPGVFPDVSLTGNWRDAGHYSQMIWPTTQRVGCGTARGPQWAYLVCRYSPPGNQDGERVP
jgi:uncharacterized protein YkwD